MMEIDVNVFKRAINILKNNSFQNIINSLHALRSHHELTVDEYEKRISELKNILVHFKRFENQMKFRAMSIETKQIGPWAPMLKQHQKASVYPDVKKETVSRLVESKKTIDSISFSIEELRLRVAAMAKSAKEASNAVKKAERQIFVLEAAADIEGFLTANNYQASEIAEFEIEKYFDTYTKGRFA